jgi:hypothetical protein
MNLKGLSYKKTESLNTHISQWSKKAISTIATTSSVREMTVSDPLNTLQPILTAKSAKILTFTTTRADLKAQPHLMPVISSIKEDK